MNPFSCWCPGGGLSERAKANGPRYSVQLHRENKHDADINTVVDVRKHNLEGAIAQARHYMPAPPKRESNGKGAIEVARMERRRAVWDKPRYWPSAWFDPKTVVPPQTYDGACHTPPVPKCSHPEHKAGILAPPCVSTAVDIPEPEPTVRMIGHTGSEATPTEVKRRFEYADVVMAYGEFSAARKMTNIAWAKVYKQGSVYVTEYGFNGHCPKLLTLRDARTPRSRYKTKR